MALNGIDVSNWQKGINLSVVPYDFVIAKATEGTSYVSPDCARQVEQVRSRGKLFGTYHYINGSGARAEAEFYIKNIKNWVGEGIICLDWESQGNKAWGNVTYLRDVAKRVIELTGIPPILYGSKSVLSELRKVSAELNCGIWVAQYANNKRTGYQANPWNEGAYACAIRQYSSAGSLSGYSGNLDLNKFYGDAAAWKRYANPGGGSSGSGSGGSSAGSGPDGSTLDLAIAVLRGEYGNGDARKQALGSRYGEVQDFINHIASASASTLASEVKAGKYGNGETRKAVLGNRYSEVQAIVNGGSKKSVSEIAKEVIAGKWGNGSSRKNKLEAAGYDYDEVQSEVNKQLGGSGSSGARTYTVKKGDTLSGIGAKLGIAWKTIASKNGIKSPYTIYPGQKLKY